MRFNRLFITIGVFTLGFSLSGCEDPELDALMDDFCNCISESRYDTDKRGECIEKMDSIKEKYKNRSSKLVKVLERTDECY